MVLKMMLTKVMLSKLQGKEERNQLLMAFPTRLDGENSHYAPQDLDAQIPSPVWQPCIFGFPGPS